MTPARALVLEKNLPVASGIGGGSADAAAALRLLGRLWGLAAGDAAGGSRPLGRDVPVCLAGQRRAHGRDRRTAVAGTALPECGIVLVNPGVALATAGGVPGARHGAWSRAGGAAAGWADAAAMAARPRATAQRPGGSRRSAVPGDRRRAGGAAALPGCLLARMSGSGPPASACSPMPAPPPVPLRYEHGRAGGSGPDPRDRAEARLYLARRDYCQRRR